MRKTAFHVLSLMISCSLAAFAVTPRFWEYFSQEELLEGTLTRVSLTWDGKLLLAPSYDLYYDTEQPFIFSMVRDKSGNLYLGTGHSGKVFKVDPQGKGSLYFQSKELDIYALAVDPAGVLYVGTSPDGKVYKVTAPDKATAFCDPEDKYIWCLLFDEQGNLFVGTGGHGLILKVNSKGEKSTFYDPGDSNITNLAWLSGGKLLAGTSPGGTVLQLEAQGKAFTLLDTPMEEIRSLAVDRFGTIYAVAASSRTGAAQPTTKPEIPAIPTTGPLPISTIQALSSLGEKPKDARSSITVPGGEQDSTGSRSAIYAISRNGSAETLYTSKDHMLYDVIVQSDESVLASTGDKGRILSLNPGKQVTVITDSAEEQVTRLLKDGNTVWAAGSNQGRVYKLGAQVAQSGTYESKPLDAKLVAAWGKISWRLSSTSSETVEFRTRTGNTEKPNKTWSDWSPPYTTGAGQQITSSNARYLQWKADIKRAASAGPASNVGYLDNVSVAYLQQNVRPQVTGITVLPSGIAMQPAPPLAPGAVSITYSSSSSQGPAPNSPRSRGREEQKLPPRQIVQPGAQSFTWKATDDNGDDLEYMVYFRGIDEKDWKLLAKDVRDTFYTLDSDSLPDGIYLLKVVASDAPSNEFGKGLIGELVSKPFVIGNGTPLVEVVNHRIEGKKVTMDFRAKVPSGRIESAEFSIDGGDWFLVFPTDGVADEAEEQFQFSTPELTAGEHLIGLRATDVNGNTGTTKLIVKIP
jgi:hypothetical protein